MSVEKQHPWRATGTTRGLITPPIVCECWHFCVSATVCSGHSRQIPAAARPHTTCSRTQVGPKYPVRCVLYVPH